jgi:acyl dehydratase
MLGPEIGASDRLAVTQMRIDLLAHATGDRRCSHVGAERVAAEPLGATIAHGVVTLSLMPGVFEPGIAIDDVRWAVDHGLTRVRFPAPPGAG